MGRDWKYWGGGGGNNNGSKTTTTASKKPRSHLQTAHAGGGGGGGIGCINAVFHFFDFHHLHSNSNHIWQTVPSFKHLPEEPEHAPTTRRGAEAPRNSLEMDPPPPPPTPTAMPIESLSNSSVIKNPEPPLNVNPMRIRILARTEDLSSESSISPSAKTPSLVARLMGLDLLPETSPRSSSSSITTTATNSSSKSRHHHLNSAPKDSKIPTNVRANRGKFVLDTDFMGSRSLPETPRTSSERRSTDVDFHRLSLQSNRSGPMEEIMELSRKSTGRRDLRVLEEEENRSPGFHARQIVKQLKDNITRKAGSDITNTVRNNNRQSDQSTVLSKSKKPESRSGDDSLSSNCSPRLRFLELKNRGANSQLSQTSKSSTQPPPDTTTTTPRNQSLVVKEEKKQSSDQKCREMGKEIRRDQRLCLGSQSQPYKGGPIPIKKRKEETFFRSKLGRKKEKSLCKKKCKKTPLSSELLNNPNLFHVKKDPPSPLTKLPKKQEYDNDMEAGSSSSSKRSLQAKTSTFQGDEKGDRGVALNSGNGGGGNGSLDLHDYVRMITAGGGLLDGWSGVFERVEAELSCLKLMEEDEGSSSSSSSSSVALLINMNLRCNRLLIFDLVKETVLVGMEESGKEIVAETISEKINKLEGGADCRVLEDIDEMVLRVLLGVDYGGIAEKERMVEKIQQQILDKLIEETLV